ncbi:hypothetical protein HON36_02875 [Candidatus Parcubacteria bacterium]|jgi:hypothetical protein|nr:hypothetical protein [Candidatus Parcubacteria bacterium]MBT7228566.1 hypothetical protein [Candidatus Parcubacteria bacterium]
MFENSSSENPSSNEGQQESSVESAVENTTESPEVVEAKIDDNSTEVIESGENLLSEAASGLKAEEVEGGSGFLDTAKEKMSQITETINTLVITTKDKIKSLVSADSIPEDTDETGEPGQMSRRKFVDISTKTAAGVAAGAELGLFSKTGEASEQTTEQENEDLEEVNELIDQYSEHETTLSESEIKDGLEQCSFVDEVSVHSLEIPEPYEMFTNTDPLKEALDKAIASGEISFDDESLEVVQVDFGDIGRFAYGAFYQHSTEAIFLDQDNDKERKKAQLEMAAVATAITAERLTLLTQVERSNLSRDEKRQKIEEIWDAMEQISGPATNPSEIPALISKHKEKVEQDLADYMASNEKQKVITETCLPHEAFHDFFKTKLGAEGYEGPGTAELLTMSLKGQRDRFGDDLPYYSDIGFNIEDLDLSDDEAIENFSTEITTKHDLTDIKPKPENFAELTKEEQDDSREKDEFESFLNEYLARIYNGAMGNTPESAEAKMDEVDAEYDTDPTEYEYDEIFHKPSEAELAMLRQMKWQGKSLVE